MFKNKLLILLVALASLFIFGGCSLSETLEEVISKRDVVAQVTYYSNGGDFGNSIKVKDIYYKENSLALDIGEAGKVNNVISGSIAVSRTGYELVGWYQVELDSKGNPVFEDEERGIYKLGEEFDFTKTLQKDDHFFIAARWRALVGVKVMMVCDEGVTIEVGEAKYGLKEGVTSLKNGDEIGELEYDSKDQLLISSETEPNETLFKLKDRSFTFIRYYADAACTTPVSGTIKRGEEDITIYAKYVQGNWTRVSTAMQARQMWSGLGQSKNNWYWLMNDIDLASARAVEPLLATVGRLQGDGHVIQNMTVEKEQLTATTERISMFGNIEQTAAIENVTFENVTMTYKAKSYISIEVYGVFTSCAAEAALSNVTISGSVSLSGFDSIAHNMTSNYDNCLFGGYASDSAYTGGITATITLKDHGNVVVSNETN